MEERLAALWEELLGVERVGRHDHFFELGGHSLLVVKLTGLLRAGGVHADVRSVFVSPVLSSLAQALAAPSVEREVPANRITADTARITPSLLPLVALSQAAIDAVVARVPGGTGNVQDIYPLSPLQEGILFHHLLGGQGADAYVARSLLRIESRSRLDRFVRALDDVIARHDILRTSLAWEGLPRAVQVVHRHARLPVEIVEASADRAVREQLEAVSDPARARLTLTQAPLMRGWAMADGDGWLLALQHHHLALDHVAMERVIEEVGHLMRDSGEALRAVAPFRSFIGRLEQDETARRAAEAYFSAELGDVEEPTAPFGVMDVRADGWQGGQTHREIAPSLGRRVRAAAVRHGVSAAAIYHLAWGRVLGACCGRNDVVYGTVLSGQQQDGASDALGMYLNTLPLRVRLNLSASAALQATHAGLGALLRHEQASLALAQRCSGVDGSTPLFTTLLNYRHSRSVDITAAIPGVELLRAEERTNYPISLSVDDLGANGFALTVLRGPGIPGDRVAAYLEQALGGLVDALETGSDVPVERISILPPGERGSICEGIGKHAAGVPSLAFVHRAFEAQVVRRPASVAVRMEGLSVDYDTLNRRANQLAHHLLASGIRPEDRVAVFMPRGVEMVVALLGVLKAGAAYVPLDTKHPMGRLGLILQDSQPFAVLTVDSCVDELPALAMVRVIVVDEAQGDGAAIAKHAQDDPVLSLDERSLAYVIYTSGSTGSPKGVMIEHGSMGHYLAWARHEYGGEDAPIDALVSSPLVFDATITSLWLPLISGGTACLLRDGQELEELEAHVRGGARGLVKISPAHLLSLGRRLQSAGASCEVEVLVVGGESLPASTVALWRGLAPRTRIVNEYGPTETTVGCVTYDATALPPGASSVPIGQPIADTRIAIVDEHGQPVPQGVIGEIHIMGAGVGRGYANREALTREKFLACEGPVGGRVFRSGDLGRLTAEGVIEFLGRNDHQVKLRGFRIELAEIESRLVEHASVREAAVTVGGKGEDRRLVGYLVVADGAAVPVELRSWLEARLPDYMVPSTFVVLDALPLTPNGKLDRKALPSPEDGDVMRRGYEAPQGEMEERLASLWQSVLGVERAGRNDHFFDLGGNSLLALQAISPIREQFGVTVTVADLFEFSVLADLAKHILARQASMLGVGELEALQKEIDALSRDELLSMLDESAAHD
ncbi:amino acid adenylation domain-containing protein [Luteibacter sahnii]